MIEGTITKVDEGSRIEARPASLWMHYLLIGGLTAAFVAMGFNVRFSVGEQSFNPAPLLVIACPVWALIVRSNRNLQRVAITELADVLADVRSRLPEGPFR